MLNEITNNFDPTPDFKPSAFDKLLNQLPEELKPLVKKSRSGLLTSLGLGYIDIVKLDELLSKAYSEYSCDELKYLGQPCTMYEFIERKFGHSVNVIICKLGCLK